MSFYDDASLVLIPSGIKTSKVYSQKPTDGTGDLTFTRASSATRVNSAGLIEKVRTNLLLQSNTFSTTWAFSGTGTVTTGAADPFGGTTAWTLAKTAASTFIFQSTTAFSGSSTFSIYAKAGTVDQVYLLHTQTVQFNAFFDLTLGTVVYSSNCVAKIVSVGGGWFRCSIAGTVSGATNIRIYPASGGIVTGTTGNILIYAAQGETGDVATDWIPTTTAAVTVGPTNNVPRLDYSGGATCPRLLLEPQRTNLFLRSEEFNNAAWTKVGVTITANATTSPDGTVNADKIVGAAGLSDKIAYQVYSTTLGQAFTLTAFYKKSEYKMAFLRAGGQTEQPYVIYNLDTQAVVSTSGATSTKIENYGNGWYRITLTLASASTTNLAPNVSFLPDSGYTLSGVNVPAYTGNGTSGGFVWGCQLEANGAAYATSYIPTTTAAVTRLADAASKTSATALIGQTEGTLFMEVDFTDTNANQIYLTISDGTINNRIHIGFDNSLNSLLCYTVSGGAPQGLITQSSPSSGIKKIAVGYKLNDYVLYINGVQVGVDSSALVPACSRLDVGGYFTAGFEYPVNQALLFKTRLTNSQLAEITTL